MGDIRRTTLLVSVFMIFISVLSINHPAYANTVHFPSTAPSNGHVTIIILDMSGSMSINDPAGLRCSAANAYIDLSGNGDAIGSIGLDNATGAAGGAHGFQTAQTWSAPVDMSTQSERFALKATIAAKSQQCKPDGNTPTYDALNRALALLQQSATGGKSGSVILLTDGVPYPNTDTQISAIQSDLIPQFQAHNWPIDSIALGADSSPHGFLSTISNATSGKFYDDGKGPIQGVSPLNLEHFFVDIFQLRENRTPGPTIPPTDIAVSPNRDFSVGSFVTHLDIIVVKENPQATIAITAPSGQTIPPAIAGTFIATDPHYAIFAIDAPQSGDWQVHLTGSGLYLMDSLTISTLQMSISAPLASAKLPLGQPVSIQAVLASQGSVIISGQFALTAFVASVGAASTATREVLLTDAAHTGVYSGTFTPAITDPPGAYQITVQAKSASEIPATAQTVVTLALFPSAILVSPATQQPTTKTVDLRVLTWDPVLRLFYSLPVIGTGLWGWHPSDWPLQGAAANPQGLAHGIITTGTTRYKNATVQATTKQGAGTTNLLIQQDPDGSFRVYLPPNDQGTFDIAFATRGTFHDGYGVIVPSTNTVFVHFAAPTLVDELRAWTITLLYLVLASLVGIFGIYGPINYLVRPKPGSWARLIDLGINLNARNRTQLHAGIPLRWKGWSLGRYFTPNQLNAAEVGLPDNLQFIFRRGHEVAVRILKPAKQRADTRWSLNDRELTSDQGTATLITHMKLTQRDATSTIQWKFEQDAANASGGAPSDADSLASRARDIAGNLGVTEALRRRRGSRND